MIETVSPAGGADAFDATAAAVLGAEGRIAHPFEITVIGQDNDDVLLRDQIFVIDVGGFIGNLRQSRVAEAIFDVFELLIKSSTMLFAARLASGCIPRCSW
jgi:hypothetical protein